MQDLVGNAQKVMSVLPFEQKAFPGRFTFMAAFGLLLKIGSSSAVMHARGGPTAGQK
jgi:hypothetical protein